MTQARLCARSPGRPRHFEPRVGSAIPAWLVVATFVCATAVGCEDSVRRFDSREAVPEQDATAQESASTLRIAIGAMISPEATQHYHEDLMKVIAARVGRQALFTQRRTYAETSDLVRTQQTDLAFVCSGPYTVGHDTFGMEILVVPVVRGKKEYNSYIIAHRDSSASSLAAMRGLRFAFTDPQSNTGSLVPRFLLAQQGETPETFFRETFFTYSHDNSIRAVSTKQADGAAVDSLIWEFFHQIDPEHTSKTKVVDRSPPYGIPPVVVHPSLPADLKERLRSVFLALHEDAEAKPVLAALQIDRFELGDDSNYESVREMQRWLETRPKE